MKQLSVLTTILMLLFVGVTLSSCSDDDDEGNVTGSSSIIGSWKCTDESGYDIMTFLSGGTGTWTFEEYGKGAYTEPFTYTYKNGILTMIVDGYEETYKLTISGNTMSFDDDVYKRVK